MAATTTVQPLAPLKAEFGSHTTSLFAAALLALLAFLLITSVRQQSPTFDEPVHLFAGFEYWKTGDFGRNPEHPPLAKLLAAAPLLSLHLQQPFIPPGIPYYKAEDGMGSVQLLYANGADANQILFRGRLVIACFSLLLALLVFLASREMFGNLPALLALTLFVFEPVLLANGAIVTTDMPLACCFFATVYAFYRFTRQTSIPRLLCVALGAALTLTVKHSGILILPTLLLLAAADLWLQASNTPASGAQPKHRAALYALALVAATLVGYASLWAIYDFRFAARPGGQQIIPGLAAYANALSPLKQAIIAFLVNHHLLPEAYLYGWVDILLIPGYRPTFLLGHIYSSGQWFYLPALFLIKTTLTLLVLLALVPLAHLGRRYRRELLFLVLPAAFLLLTGAASLVNMGIRHLLPMYAFCVVLAGAAAAAFASHSRPARLAVGAIIAFAVVSSLHAYPDYLAYSNEFVGGPAHTYQVAADSNDDWGQTLKWTRTYLDRHPAGPCWIDYTSPTIPLAYYGIHCRPLLTGMGHLMGVPSAPVPSQISGTVLVSANDIAGFEWGPAELNPYAPFRDSRPEAVIGNAVLVYRGTFNAPLLAAQNNATLATALLRSGNPTGALPLARAAAAQAPASADIQAILAQILFAAGQPAEGGQHMATAIHLAQTIHPDYQRILLHGIEHPLVPPPSNPHDPASGSVRH